MDVREQWEWDLAHIADSLHIPMGQITSRYSEIPEDRPIICICHHGVRSMQVGIFLKRHGYTQIFNLHGGIDAWARDLDPTIARY